MDTGFAVLDACRWLAVRDFGGGCPCICILTFRARTCCLVGLSGPGTKGQPNSKLYDTVSGILVNY